MSAATLAQCCFSSSLHCSSSSMHFDTWQVLLLGSQRKVSNLLLVHSSEVIYSSEKSSVQLLSLSQLAPTPTSRSRPESWSFFGV